ncbi:bifunctional 2-polyprenyl-6-hydroxyphenol methylase/3-demethylubiquinol 3-O-methyltransferase UbiG [Agaribacter marinus]|uniref:Ubiquinone biosynthesis O-methyltransferase n=1 Tax=Agaribacter marinus TaxID=1431249 RepID=A0AA37SUB1_9ALTE|nr:bifunctional 2-polyprenyl-6-hydroxyphenol methylase/3-demethylubiquinol 3-O-methyltransferase UbiG [Agaribacter marinus]GLR69966.1 ubiquinone biosynthesis O-methyltransferase [Agaribacter marinus]
MSDLSNSNQSSANVDAEELSKFAELAAYWWDRDGEFKSLHDINPLRVDYIENQANGIFGKQIIDIGCGGGILSEALATKGANVTGIDMVEASLEVANLHRLESGLHVQYHLSTAEQWAEQHACEYDIVCCLEMLEHVPHPESIVAAAAKLVKPGGMVIFSTLNRNPKSWLMAIAAAEYLFNMVPKGTHDHAKFIKPSELLNMIETTQLQVSDMTGLHFNPIKQQYFLSNMNVDVNYFVVCTSS